jgi:hypothetical protein
MEPVCLLRSLVSSSLLTHHKAHVQQPCQLTGLFSLFASHLAHLFLLHIFFLNSSYLESLSFTQQLVLTHLFVFSIPSVFYGIFFCPGFVYLVLAGMTLLGMAFLLTSLHIGHELLQWFPILLQKQQPKSFLSD